uniref:Uncharacterized protein n=1 Tax=Florenciella sp. virus SA2 TaxID=3240092 RepID=A0AB39JA59_9VIRU
MVKVMIRLKGQLRNGLKNKRTMLVMPEEDL